MSNRQKYPKLPIKILQHRDVLTEGLILKEWAKSIKNF